MNSQPPNFFDGLPEDLIIGLGEMALAGLAAYGIQGLRNSKILLAAESALQALKDAPKLKAGPELAFAMSGAESGALAYAAVQGKIEAFDGLIPPSKNLVSSVIRVTNNQEMLSKLGWNGERYKFAGKSYENMEFYPFCLTATSKYPDASKSTSYGSVLNAAVNLGRKMGVSGPGPVLLIKDITAPNTEDLLQTFPTYSENRDLHRSRLDSLLDYLFGFATLSEIRKTESLLPVNEIITALGRVSVDKEGQFVLTAPSVPHALYMLTPKSVEEIIREYSVLSAWRSAVVFFIAFGGTCLLIDGLRRLKQLIHSVGQGDVSGTDEDDNPRYDMVVTQNPETEPIQILCVICQERPRNVVFLNCRHFAACEICSAELTTRQCPICRQQVVRSLNVFVS